MKYSIVDWILIIAISIICAWVVVEIVSYISKTNREYYFLYNTTSKPRPQKLIIEVVNTIEKRYKGE